MNLFKKILFDQRGFMRSATYTPPPATPAPTDEESRLAAEEAAAKEREELRKKRRPTMLTGARGVPGEPSVYKPQLTGIFSGGKTLG